MKKYGKRLMAITVLLLVVASVFVVRLVKLQLIDGKDYYEKSKNSVATKTVVKAARGDILDRNCEPFVQSVSSLNVVITRSESEDLNKTIKYLIDIFKKSGDKYETSFPIVYGNGNFSYVPDYTSSDSRVKTFEDYRINTLKTDNDLTKIMNAVIERYKLEEYSIEEATEIASVRYEIETASQGAEFVFANNVSTKTSTMIEENKSYLKGVSLENGFTRSYTEDGIASHILGTVGKIYADEYETLMAQGYSPNDYVGKDGIEKVCEVYLRGTDGYRYTINDESGTVVDVVDELAEEEGLASLKAKAGYDVILTLDRPMQVLTEKGLEKLLYDCRERNGQDSATAATVIFMDPNSGEIFSMANYPTFNASTFNQDYASLAANENKPLLNRAISGLYAPGSTFKMVTAVTALEEKVISKFSTFTCTGIYTYYDDYQPSCFNRKAHGEVDVITALKQSCNNFFFDVGRRSGIDTLNEYAYKFGFGRKTGIELLGEANGIVAGREYRESIGKIWEDGETLLAAIGQSDNAVTPIQLVNYVATIGNGGKFYTPHVIQSVRDRDKGETIVMTENKYKDLGISKDTLNTVVDGMVEVAQTGGSAGSGFSDYTLTSIAVKTGTAEVAGKKATSLLVGFAPAKNPEIAFVLIVEQAGTGTTYLNAQYVTKILEYYFSDRLDFESVKEGGQIIG